MQDISFTPKGFRKVDLEDEQIFIFLAAFRDLLTLPEMADLTPYYEQALETAALAFQLSPQELLSYLPPSAPLAQQKARFLSFFQSN